MSNQKGKNLAKHLVFRLDEIIRDCIHLRASGEEPAYVLIHPDDWEKMRFQNYNKIDYHEIRERSPLTMGEMEVESVAYETHSLTIVPQMNVAIGTYHVVTKREHETLEKFSWLLESVIDREVLKRMMRSEMS